MAALMHNQNAQAWFVPPCSRHPPA